MMKKTGIILAGIAAAVFVFAAGIIKINVTVSGSETTQFSTVSSVDGKAETTKTVEDMEHAEPVSDEGVSRDTRVFWSSYEAFADEYSDFSQNYDPKDMHTLNKALDYLDKALDYAVKAAKYDELKMSATDARYVAAERKLVEEKLSRVNTEV